MDTSGYHSKRKLTCALSAKPNTVTHLSWIEEVKGGDSMKGKIKERLPRSYQQPGGHPTETPKGLTDLVAEVGFKAATFELWLYELPRFSGCVQLTIET